MKDIKKYYENTENALPHSIVKEFLEMNIKSGNAIDLGCGAGRDTIYLLKNGWKVLAIDKEDTKEIISNKLNTKEKTMFKFEKQSFEKIELDKNNLIVANFSLPFCDKNYFKELWIKITNSILEERLLYWKFFRFK